MSKAAPPAYDSSGYHNSGGGYHSTGPGASYGQPGYNQPQQGYHQPQQGYHQPQQGYHQPQQGYHQPQQGYHQPQQGYNQSQLAYNQPQAYGSQGYTQGAAPGPYDGGDVVSGGAPEMDKIESRCRDPVCAFLFVGQLIAILAVGIVYIRKDHQVNFSFSQNTGKLIQAIVIAVVISVVMALAFLEYVRRNEGKVVFTAFVFYMAVLLAGGIIALSYGITGAGIPLIILAALALLWYYCVRSRVPLTEAMINSSSHGLHEYWGVYMSAFSMVVVTAVWIAFWAFSVVYTLGDTQHNARTKDENKDGLVGLYGFLFVLAFYWSFQVFQNIAHTTTAGAIGTWWYQPEAKSGVTSNAFRRATTWSLGSIAFGSFIVAFIQTLRYMIRNAVRRDGEQSILACIALCLLACIERIAELFNVYAYTIIALYGHDYLAAAKQTHELFKARGFQALIQDDLTGIVVFCGAFISGAAATLVAGLGLYFTNKEAFGATTGSAVAFFFLLFFVGVCCGSIILAQLSSAVCTTFVVWAQDPAEMERTRPTWFAKLRDARPEDK